MATNEATMQAAAFKEHTADMRYSVWLDHEVSKKGLLLNLFDFALLACA